MGKARIRARSPAQAGEEPRLREFVRAALLTNGNLRRIGNVLGLPARMVAKRLALLKRLDAARTFTVHDPLAQKACQTTAWVRMLNMAPEAVERFEQALHDDARVVSAQRVAGDFDYRMSCFHESYEEAGEWVRALRCRPEVAEVRQLAMRHIFGHELAGMVLREG